MHSHCNIWMPNRISLGGDGAQLNARILLQEIKEQTEKERETEREQDEGRGKWKEQER